MPATKTELKVRDVMTSDPVCVSPSTTIRELARIFEEHEISGAPVIDHSGRVIGVVSKTDLIRRCSEGTGDIAPAYLFEVLSDQEDDTDSGEIIPEPLVCVEDFMTEDPLMVAPTTHASAAAKLMYDKRIHRIIIADDDRFPVGIVTSMDLLGVFGR